MQPYPTFCSLLPEVPKQLFSPWYQRNPLMVMFKYGRVLESNSIWNCGARSWAGVLYGSTLLRSSVHSVSMVELSTHSWMIEPPTAEHIMPRGTASSPMRSVRCCAK